MSRIRLEMNRFGAISAAVRQSVGEVVAKTAFNIEAGAKAEAPVDTGALRNSIQANVEKAASDLRADVSVGVEYGVHQEFGTHKQPAHPFLTPASEAQRQPFERGVAAAVERAAKDAAK